MIFRLSLVVFAFVLSGCSVSYVLRSGYEQVKILNSREPIEELIDNNKLDETEKRKLELVLKVKEFAENKLKMKKSKNYRSYVKLDRPYVSWLLRVSDKDQIKSYTWWFPITGSFPYKGYFKKQQAIDEAERFNKKGYDTYVRGVSAYSTLGWFNDPVLSSMLRYEDHGLVELIIHETIHENLFIKDKAEFNERLATFLGEKGADLFYSQQQNVDKKLLKLLANERKDNALFSSFISEEIRLLKEWYKNQEKPIDETVRSERLKLVQENFAKKLKPKLNTKMYLGFEKRPINNASLLSYETYVYDMTDFEKAYEKLGSDFEKFFEFCKGLEKEDDPVEALKKFAYSDPRK